MNRGRGSDKGYKEWKDKETSGEDKHRVYIVGPVGEVGYFNVKTNNFHNSSTNKEILLLYKMKSIFEVLKNYFLR